ncbi:hypothetical protein AB3S75_011404 [Citrus x aurantiifolia]
MGKRSRRKHEDDTPTSSSSLSSSDDSESLSKRRRRHRKEKERKRERRKKRERERSRKKSRREEKTRKKRDYESSDDGSGSDSEPDMSPEEVVRDVLTQFPNVGNDLKTLLQMIDDGQAVDIRGISEKSLVKHVQPKESEAKDRLAADNNLEMPGPMDDPPSPQRRVIGPAMPSAELLAAAAKLTEAQAELRDAELEEDTELFIGPPPPAMVAEAETANEAERFEEVTRIMGVEGDCPYDVIGANHNMSAENIKKRYWKLSLFVHPDKCPHPQAHQAFIKLNKAFKELQDPEKRKALDEKIKLKEEQEKFKVELKAMQEGAQWRKSQGILMEGDDELLADMEVKAPPKRDEWMTTLPPERKPGGGVPMHSTKTFSRTSKEGRGDTSVWTDTPSDRAQKAKMNYLEAYSETSALASTEEEKKGARADADLVDKYNKEKRSKSLVQKHQEEGKTRAKKKSKQQPEKEEWVGEHPWKPWDREKDLVAGRQNIKFDSENMAEGLSSRFSSGNFQRNFL